MSQQNKNEQTTFNQNEKQYSSKWKDEIPNCLAFEVEYRMTKANYIKIWIDYFTFKNLIDIYVSNVSTEARLFEELRRFPRIDNTKSNIWLTDIETGFNILYKNFPEIRNFWTKLPTDGSQGLVVKTNRDGDWNKWDFTVHYQSKDL